MGVVCGAHGIETLSILTTHTVDKHTNAHNAAKAQMLGNLIIGLSKALAGSIGIGQTSYSCQQVNEYTQCRAYTASIYDSPEWLCEEQC